MNEVTAKNPVAAEPVAETSAARKPAKAAAKTATKRAVKTAAKPAVKAATKPAVKSASKVAAKAPAKVTVKPAVKPAAKVASKATPAAKANGAATQAPKVRKPKVVQASFNLHEDEHTVLKDLKQACKLAATDVKKSELVRAALTLLKSLDVTAIKALVERLPSLKAAPKSKA